MRFRPRSTDGESQRILSTVAMQPAKKFSFPALDRCSDSHLLGVSAVELDAPPALISGSPIFLFFKLTSNSGTISFRFPDVSSFIPPTLSTIYCSILARHSCVLPVSDTTWTSCNTSVLVQNVMSQIHFYTSAAFQLIILSDCWFLLRAPYCGIPKTAMPTHRFNNFKSQALSPSRRHTQRVFIAPVGVNSRNSPARSRSLPTKTPRMFNLAPSSEWFRPNHTSHHKAFSRLPSLGNCLQHMHSVVPSSPSTHDPVQLLSCISLRRLLEMPEPVPE